MSRVIQLSVAATSHTKLGTLPILWPWWPTARAAEPVPGPDQHQGSWESITRRAGPMEQPGSETRGAPPSPNGGKTSSRGCIWSQADDGPMMGLGTLSYTGIVALSCPGRSATQRTRGMPTPAGWGTTSPHALVRGEHRTTLSMHLHSKAKNLPALGVQKPGPRLYTTAQLAT